MDSAGLQIESMGMHARKREPGSPAISSSDLALKAIENMNAFTNGGLSGVEAILFSTGTADNIGTSTGVILKRELGLSNCAVHDITAGCSGLVFALNLASAYICSGKYSRVLVINSDTLSNFASDRHREVSPSDDISVAVLVSHDPGSSTHGCKVKVYTNSEHCEAFFIPCGGSKFRYNKFDIIQNKHHLFVNKEVLKAEMNKSFGVMVDELKNQMEDVDYALFNCLPDEGIIEKLDKYGVSREKVKTFTEFYEKFAAGGDGVRQIPAGNDIVLFQSGAGVNFGYMRYRF